MCGVVGITGTSNAAREAFLALTTLQHRGQDAAGILTYDQEGFHLVKNLGLVDTVFDRDNFSSLSGSMAVGHARYSTIGKGDLVDVQPFLMSFPFGIGLVHNGNLVNYTELAQDLKKRGFSFLGPVVCYAHMQATGMVNDHTVDCFRYKEVQKRK